MADLVFNENMHLYTLGDKNLISCTELLSKHHITKSYDGVDKDLLEKAQNYGTFIHKQFENYNKGLENELETPELYNYKVLCKNVVKEVLESEHRVNNDIVAGTCDFMYLGNDGLKHRVDFKTSTNVDTYGTQWQLSLYDYLDNEKADILEIWHLDKITKEITIMVVNKVEISNIERLLDCERNGELFTNSVVILDNEELAKLEDIQKQIIVYETLKTKLEKDLDALKDKIKVAMRENNCKSFENDTIKITYVAPYEKTRVDTKALKEMYKDIYDKYTITTVAKDSVKITIKEK